MMVGLKNYHLSCLFQLQKLLNEFHLGIRIKISTVFEKPTSIFRSLFPVVFLELVAIKYHQTLKKI